MIDQNTIAAIATPPGTGGIGIVRISGEEAFTVAGRVCRIMNKCSIAEMSGYTCAYARVFDSDGDIDEAVVTVFRAPKSFTGEDVVELAIHGGVYLLNRLLRVCCENGARLANAGEFTKRAFLNGKFDLTRAEAISDLIAAQGRHAARAALAARDGALYQKIHEISEGLIAQAAHLAAWVDYPEEEISEVNETELLQALEKSKKVLQTLVESYDTGKVIRDGIDVAILGRPNAGKSTLMNLLAGYDRSIVTDIAGTTRDIVSDRVLLGDLTLNLCDTAGIRQSSDPVEQAGVRRAEDQVNKAQLILAVFDGSDQLDENDRRVIESCRGTLCVAIVNKNDLPQKISIEELEKDFSYLMEISAKKRNGAEQLTKIIEELFQLGKFDAGAEMLANERQYAAAFHALQEVEDAINALSIGVSYDAVTVCVENAINELLELTGKRATQEVVDQVFAKFCVGK